MLRAEARPVVRDAPNWRVGSDPLPRRRHRSVRTVHAPEDQPSAVIPAGVACIAKTLDELLSESDQP
jgi:hypothetical protein